MHRLRTPIWRLVLAPVVVLLGAGVLGACEDESEGPEQGVTLENIVEEPGAWIGEDVVVSGEVLAVVTPSAIRIGEAGLLVFQANLPEGIDFDDVVRVQGTVREVDVTTFEEDFGVEDEGFFDDETVTEGEPAIAATNVTIIEEGEFEDGEDAENGVIDEDVENGVVDDTGDTEDTQDTTTTTES